MFESSQVCFEPPNLRTFKLTNVPMKLYKEHIWLGAALLLMVLTALDFRYLRIINILLLITGIMISGFLFAYHRNMRKIEEKKESSPET